MSGSRWLRLCARLAIGSEYEAKRESIKLAEMLAKAREERNVALAERHEALHKMNMLVSERPKGDPEVMIADLRMQVETLAKKNNELHALSRGSSTVSGPDGEPIELSNESQLMILKDMTRQMHTRLAAFDSRWQPFFTQVAREVANMQHLRRISLDLFICLSEWTELPSVHPELARHFKAMMRSSKSFKLMHDTLNNDVEKTRELYETDSMVLAAFTEKDIDDAVRYGCLKDAVEMLIEFDQIPQPRQKEIVETNKERIRNYNKAKRENVKTSESGTPLCYIPSKGTFTTEIEGNELVI